MLAYMLIFNTLYRNSQMLRSAPRHPKRSHTNQEIKLELLHRRNKHQSNLEGKRGIEATIGIREMAVMNLDDEDRRPSKQNDRGPQDGFPRRRLKCPFYQRQPEKYARAACRGEGFADMAKLK